jgi:hypothetical protein
MGRSGSARAAVWGIALLLAAACGRGGNPLLGDWEIDRTESSRGAVLAAEAAELAALRFRKDAIVAGDTVIPVTYAVEGNAVRAVREDGRGEHRIEVRPDGSIQVELPIGVTATYRRAAS